MTYVITEIFDKPVVGKACFFKGYGTDPVTRKFFAGDIGTRIITDLYEEPANEDWTYGFICTDGVNYYTAYQKRKPRYDFMSAPMMKHIESFKERNPLCTKSNRSH